LRDVDDARRAGAAPGDPEAGRSCSPFVLVPIVGLISLSVGVVVPLTTVPLALAAQI